MVLNLPKDIKFIITDFDGVITDNCVYIDSKGEMTRKVNFKDIMAFYMLKKQGYKVGIISGEQNSAIDLIKEKLQIDEVHQNIRVKLDVLNDILSEYDITRDDVVYVGDDINDYEVLKYVKYPVTVPDAVGKIKDIEGIQITSTKGGEGAFREIADAILG